MFKSLLILALATGCVPKKRYDSTLSDLSRIQAEMAETQTALDASKADADALEAALSTEREANEALSELASTLDARNQAAAKQLADLTARLADLKANSKADKAAKAELESLLGTMTTEAEAAREDAAAAQERAKVLAAERERLAAEREAFAAEAARLAAEKAALEARTAAYDALVGELESEIEAGQITITELSGKLTVNMSNAILFDSGATTVKKEGKDALAKVAGVLSSVTDREIRVEGHTDNVPVGAGASYPDNWALSALRASTVVGLLTDGGVDPLNIAVVGYGEHRPTTDNADKAGRAQNRRTEIVLVPRLE